MLRLENRDSTTIQNPPTGDIVFFNEDSVLKTKDDAGVVEALAVADPTEPKVYVALLSQSGTNAPVATVLKNTLGGVPVYTYNNVGAYVCTLIGAFPTGKTNIETSTIYWLDTAIEDMNKFVKVVKFTEDDYTIVSSLDGAHENNILNNFYLKIEVYP